MITIKGEGLQDGLYNIKNGKIFKYKAKGGTVRTYEMGEMRMSDEKTLWIKTDKMEQIMRVIVENGHFCKVFYLESEDGEE